jgi:hypothetical protein
MPAHCHDQTHSTAHDAWGVFLKLVGPLPNRVGHKNHDAVAIVCTACSLMIPPSTAGSRMTIEHAHKKHNCKQLRANGGIKRSMPPPTPPPGLLGPNGWYGNGGGMYHCGAFRGSMFGNGGGMGSGFI